MPLELSCPYVDSVGQVLVAVLSNVGMVAELSDGVREHCIRLKWGVVLELCNNLCFVGGIVLSKHHCTAKCDDCLMATPTTSC